MRHHVEFQYDEIVAEIDTYSSRASCSCGWSTGWDSGWRFVTRLRVRWHLRRAGKDNT